MMYEFKFKFKVAVLCCAVCLCDHCPCNQRRVCAVEGSLITFTQHTHSWGNKSWSSTWKNAFWISRFQSTLFIHIKSSDDRLMGENESFEEHPCWICFEFNCLSKTFDEICIIQWWRFEINTSYVWNAYCSQSTFRNGQRNMFWVLVLKWCWQYLWNPNVW